MLLIVPFQQSSGLDKLHWCDQQLDCASGIVLGTIDTHQCTDCHQCVHRKRYTPP